MRRHIVKSTGNLEIFSAKKLQKSIERTGLQPKISKKISHNVSKKIMPGCNTREIYKHTIQLINKESPIAAVHYSLKKSLQELGPTGYEFELFVSKYFEAIGFETQVGVIVAGKFVKHEVDVVAKKSKYLIYTECKFHNNPARKNDIKTVLYVKARWDDLKSGPQGSNLREFYLATNTVFTTDALIYSKGTRLKLLGVNAPEDESFLDKIKRYKLYPITSLKRLKFRHRHQLLANKIILCKDLLNERNFLIDIGLSDKEITNLFNDIHRVLQIGRNLNEN